MEPSDAEAKEKIALKERIDVSTKLFTEYHASIRGYDTICAALSTAMLVIIPIVFAAISYIIKETPGEFRPIILIIFGLWTQLFSAAFIRIFLALLGERSSNYLRMQMSLAELAVFSDMPAIKGIQKTYELRGTDHFEFVVDNDTKSEIDDSKKINKLKILANFGIAGLPKLARRIGVWGSIPAFVASVGQFMCGVGIVWLIFTVVGFLVRGYLSL